MSLLCESFGDKSLKLCHALDINKLLKNYGTCFCSCCDTTTTVDNYSQHILSWMVSLLVFFVIAKNIAAATTSNGDTDPRERNNPKPFEMIQKTLTLLDVWFNQCNDSHFVFSEGTKLLWLKQFIHLIWFSSSCSSC